MKTHVTSDGLEADGLCKTIAYPFEFRFAGTQAHGRLGLAPMLDCMRSVHGDTAASASACSFATSNISVDDDFDDGRLVLPREMVHKPWLRHSVPYQALQLIVGSLVGDGELSAELLAIVGDIDTVLSHIVGSG